MPYLNKYRDRLLRLQTFARFRGDNNFIKELVDCGFFLDSRERVCCFYCGCGFDISAAAGRDLHTLHYKSNPQCCFLLSLISERDRKKLRLRAKYTAPFTYFVRVASPSHHEFIDCYNRLESLAGTQDCVRIARAGFFRDGKGFSCYDCGCSISAFIKSPWREHCILNPNCRHLIQSRGFYYIQKYL
jgi:Inhibitor of Apoptosis domain